MPFNPQECKEFEVITSSLGDPQSNGKVESAIKTAKAIMKNAKEAGADIYLSILDSRTHHLKECQVLLLKGCSDVDHEHFRPPPPPPPVLLKPKIQENAKDKLIKQKSKQVNRNT